MVASHHSAVFAPARIAELTNAGLRVEHFRFRAGVELPTHDHPEPMLVVQLHGGFSGSIGERAYELGAGGVAWLAATARHAERIGPRVSEAILVRLPERDTPTGREVLVHRSLRSQRLGAQLAREVRRPDGASAWIAESLVLQFLGLFDEEAASVRRGDGAWVEDAIGILKSAGLERQLGLTELATCVGVDRCHLARRLKDRLGIPAGAFLRRRRIERARQLLLETDRSIAWVAHECGFYDHAHFCNLFRRAHGRTPSAYRAAQ